jgi:MFS family permease
VRAALLAPVRALRRQYLPLLMVYFSQGAIGLIAIAESFWVKKSLTLSPADLAGLGVWLTLPWAIKMVFGELVDSVAVFGSQRRSYLVIGAFLVAAAMLLLAGAASGALTLLPPDKIYVIASLLSVIGIVMQDVVADTMTTEVVDRTDAAGRPRPDSEINADLAMVQVLGRLALGIGALVVALLGGWLASILPYHQVFLLGTLIPAVSLTGTALVRSRPPTPRPTDWTILGGGLAFGAAVVTLGSLNVPYGQEITFVVSMAVVITMLKRVTTDIAPDLRRRIAFAAMIIFFFRAYPGLGAGYDWFAIDKLGFDEAFQGRLQFLGALFALMIGWLLSDTITRQPMTRVLMWLTILGSILYMPNLFLIFEGHLWTERVLGIGARSIAIVDAAVTSPLVNLGMIPLLTLVAIYAPPDRRATWFALMASFMNLALIAGQLMTKYLNVVFPVARGDYANLPELGVAVGILGLLIPLTALTLLGRRVA